MASRRPVRHRRLAAQRITRPAATPAEAVAWLAAVQAQDYLASLWAVGVRTRRATAAAIEHAIADGAIVRIHAFRGTLQYVARDDLRWMLALIARRVISAASSRFRQLGLDERTLRRAGDALRDATRGGAALTRSEVAVALRRARIATDGQRLVHLIAHAELDGAICSGARRGKQQTFASFAERVPPAPERSRDGALAELARRFYRSRGPATLRDFVWWTGLPVKDARAGLEAVAGELGRETLDGRDYWSAPTRRTAALPAYLLPAFDEYLIGYQDRRDVVAAEHTRAINGGGGLLAWIVVVDGEVIGTWRRSFVGAGDAAGVAIELRPFHPWERRARTAVAAAAERYAAFLALPLVRLATA